MNNCNEVKESECMKSLQNRLSDIDTLIASNSQQTTEIINQTKLSENEMEAAFFYLKIN